MTDHPGAQNLRVRRELRRIGYPDIDRLPFAAVTPRLLWLVTQHGERVMRRTPAGQLKARKAMGKT